MSDDTPRMRLGGMALANGLLVHGPTQWAAAVVADDGEVVVGSGPKPRLAVGPLVKVPLVRGVVRLAESMMVVPAMRGAMPEARMALEDRPVGALVLATMAGAALARRTVKGAVAQEAVAVSLNLLPVLVMLRFSPASRWHAVEHKSIAAYERAGEAGLATNATDPKEHRRCGSNLVAPMLLTGAVANLAARAMPNWRARMAVRAAGTVLGIGATVEAFAFADRHPRSPLARVLHGAGHAIQAWFVTVEPDEEELAVGRTAMHAILAAEQDYQAEAVAA